MAAVSPNDPRAERPTWSAREPEATSATSILPNLDGSYVVEQLGTAYNVAATTSSAKDRPQLRRVSSEADQRTQAHDATHYDRSENSSAFVSSDEKFASLAHLVSAMNPMGMETRAKTANHDAIVRHFQLRRVSGEASRASYTKPDDHDNDALEQGTNDPSADADGSLRKLFASRRLTQTPMLSTAHYDSMRNVNRDKGETTEIAVTSGSMCLRLRHCRKRMWRRCRSAARACLLPMSPTGTVASLRAAITLIVVVAQLFLAPFTPVYFPAGSHSITTLAVLFDVAFLIDVLLGFNTSFYDEKNDRLESDRRKAVQRFVSSRHRYWLFIDFLSAIPVQVVLLLVRRPHENRSSLSPLPPLSWDIASAFLRLLRWTYLLPETIWGVRMVRATTQLPLRLSFQRYAPVAHAARIVVLFFGAVHYVACCFRASLRGEVHLDPDPWSTYVADLSTAAQLLWGHLDHPARGRPSPSPIFCFIAMTTGAIVVAYITSSFTLLLFRINSNSTRYDNKLVRVHSTMDKMQLPRPLQRRIHQYYDHLWGAHDATDASEIAAFSKALSPSLSLEVNLFKYMDLVLSVPFWRNCSADFVTQIMRNLQMRTYLPEDYIMRQGEIGDNLFLINHGVCELRARVGEDGKTKLQIPRMRRMHAGTAFGELSLLMNYRRTATVRAVTFVEMCILERSPFQTILTRYRDDRREVLREILVSSIDKKAQRFLPFPYEPLIEHVMGADSQKPSTPWEAAEVLVDMILAPECVDESIEFGFKDLDSFAQNRLVPVTAPSTSLSPTAQSPTLTANQQKLTGVEDIVKRLGSMEQQQADTAKRLAGLEQGMESILRALTSLTASLNGPTAHSITASASK